MSTIASVFITNLPFSLLIAFQRISRAIKRINQVQAVKISIQKTRFRTLDADWCRKIKTSTFQTHAYHITRLIIIHQHRKKIALLASGETVRLFNCVHHLAFSAAFHEFSHVFIITFLCNLRSAHVAGFNESFFFGKILARNQHHRVLVLLALNHVYWNCCRLKWEAENCVLEP